MVVLFLGGGGGGGEGGEESVLGYSTSTMYAVIWRVLGIFFLNSGY